MAELGADPQIIADALAARPDWTPEQVRARWEYDARRIRASEGKLHEGVFFHALRCGQLAPPRQSYQLDPADYAHRDDFALGSDVPSPSEPESIRDRALRLLPPPTPETLRLHTRDWMFIQSRLGAGDTDEQALAALALHQRRTRGAP